MALGVYQLVDFIEAYTRHYPSGVGFRVTKVAFSPDEPDAIWLTLLCDTGNKEVVRPDVDEMQGGARAILDYVNRQLSPFCNSELEPDDATNRAVERSGVDGDAGLDG